MNLTLFDLDGTLIPGDSDHEFGAFMGRMGWAGSPEWLARNEAFYADYKREQLDISAYIEFATSAWRHRPESELAAAQRRFMAESIEPQMHAQALDLVRRHQAAGDLVAIVTATNEFVTAPIAQAFGVEHLIAVRLKRNAAGACTGEIDGVPSFREGKIRRVHEWLAAQRRQWAEFERVTFYSDSTNDLPLLELASHPVATNPTPALEAIAAQRGWPLLKLFT